MRLKIAQLAASPTPPLNSIPRFRNELLQDQMWPEDVKWLRDAYNDIVILWEEIKAPEQDTLLFKQTEPKLRELVFNLLDIAHQVPRMPMIKQHMQNARHDFEISTKYSQSKDLASAVLYQSYSLAKIHGVLETLTRAANAFPRQRFSSFNEKTAYGYDVGGEISEGSGEIANRENQTNINDTAQPQDHHETGGNPANLTRDCEADKEFPTLAEKKNKRVSWPPRM